MSQENVGIVRGFYRPGDPSRFFDLLDEEVEVDAARRPLPDHPEVIRGKDAVIDFYRHYWGTWEDFVLEPTEVVAAGENRVVATHHERGRGRGSGVTIERSTAVLYTLRAGKLARLQFFNTRDEALEAVGLRE